MDAMKEAFQTVQKYIATKFNRFAQYPYLLGHCNVCGNDVAFFTESKAMYRELLKCSECCATCRYRTIAKGFLRAVDELAGIKADSIAELNKFSPEKCLNVYDTQPAFYFDNLAYPLPDMLNRVSWIKVECSRFDPTVALGTRFDISTTNQNLECLTFPDASFDVVITSDVIEHVRLADRAHKEIRRVLKSGGDGIYLFTVPIIRTRYESEIRVEIVDPEDPAKDIIHQLEYHGDENSAEGRALTYRSYGSGIDDELKELGFDVSYEAYTIPELGLMQTDLFYCRLKS